MMRMFLLEIWSVATQGVVEMLLIVPGVSSLPELTEMDTDNLLSHRNIKFRQLGGFVEAGIIEPEKGRNMKNKEAGIAQTATEIKVEIQNIKGARDAECKPSSSTIYDEAMEKLGREVDNEITDAFISMGLQEKLEAIKMEISKSSKTSNNILSPSVKERVDKLVQEFNHALSRPGSYMGLKQKLEMLTEASRLIKQQTKARRVKKGINEKLREQMKGKMEILRKAREKVAKGGQLDEKMEGEVERTKEEMKEML